MMRQWLAGVCLVGAWGIAGCGAPATTPPTDATNESAPQSGTESPLDAPKPSVAPKESTRPISTNDAATNGTSEPSPSLLEPQPEGQNRLTPAEVSEGWLKLFDGVTLFGWTPSSDAAWTVKEGTIAVDSGAQGLLVSTARFADFELRCDFQLAEGGNSGLFLRTTPDPKDPTVDCYELNICDNRPEFGTASLVGRQEPSEKVVAGAGWRTFRVRVEGPQVTAELNGKPILEYTDTTPNPLKSGRIGLQFREGAVAFRNIFVKPLGLQPLFDGKTLSGWREVPGSQSEFVVKNGEIQVTGGRGFLESEPTAANFVFQFEAITHGDVLNSGVFFRAIPGTEANPSDGYEFQIQNGFKDNDRNKPADFGTGALFRRVAARQVVANDREWLTGTLIADGPHFSTWVNGIPVVDWTDERPADPNPRKGLRLEAGHLSLQGHDPGTKLSFRNLRWANLPE